MLFYTAEFGAFLVLLVAVFAVIRGNGGRKAALLVASYVFYMWWNPAFITLIMLSTAVDYFVGRRLDIVEDPKRRRALLVASIAANLGILGFFKYAGFFHANALWALRALGHEPSSVALNIVLPVGVSFYTFQSMSYTIDVYRRRLPATRSALDFALFVSFFPQLVAGPIVRAADFLPQLRGPVRVAVDRRSVMLFLRGLTKKVIIADNLAPFADAVFDAPEGWPSAVIWVAAVCFYVQIYCDFSGYSDMAIALASLFGFTLPANFAHPYFATNPTAFWRRWHISLSGWLRDYLYIPLGGSRQGALMTARNLMLTMLLGGLWHGASWNFVLWGAMHGVGLVAWRAIEPLCASVGARVGRVARVTAAAASWVAFQYWVLLTWLVFRVADPTLLRIAL
ncbi:MBOAT family protein, partial [Candidatus Poribacteria bacterium]|nr:MBOAT family protein [Candidatus Poribacteria bacterium]